MQPDQSINMINDQAKMHSFISYMHNKMSDFGLLANSSKALHCYLASYPPPLACLSVQSKQQQQSFGFQRLACCLSFCNHPQINDPTHFLTDGIHGTTPHTNPFAQAHKQKLKHKMNDGIFLFIYSILMETNEINPNIQAYRHEKEGLQ